jgi:hypothetical protein
MLLRRSLPCTVLLISSLAASLFAPGAATPDRERYLRLGAAQRNLDDGGSSAGDPRAPPPSLPLLGLPAPARASSPPIA